MKKTVGEFLKEQDCLFVKMTIDNKVYFCEYLPTTVMWYGKPVEVGIHFKDTCIVAGLDEFTVIDYSADLPFGETIKRYKETNEVAIKLWEAAHHKIAVDYIDWKAREEWLKACEEE